MNRDLSDYRQSYENEELIASNLPDNPMDLFEDWFNQADNVDGIREANAMTLNTIGEDGFPKGRVVLLKEFSVDGLI
ncbi:MAG: pyridoxamine 5'-phosphate oxidase, partial [Flavobacteriaceae bacterium]|nr:pyridoxamine 5'-phosphate oxidase [Flavobacteriaceae bacterium]